MDEHKVIMGLKVSRRPLLWGAAALLVAAAALFWALGRGTPVDAYTVRLLPLVRTAQFSARVEALSRVEVGSTVTGRVARVWVAEGDRVRRDDVLVQLETPELQAGVDQALAAEAQARARLSGLRSTGRAQAAAAEAQAAAGVTAARAELDRARQLLAQGFVSASRVDDAQRALAVAQALQAGARAQVQAITDGGTDVMQAVSQLDAARAAAAVAVARLAQARVLAPADALVLSRDVEPGQIVQPGRALMGLALNGPTLLVAQADERFLDQLRPGQTASVVADAYADQPFAARVLTIAPAVDAQRGAVEVRFELLAQPPAFLRQDMTLSVAVETARRERALALPLAGLQPMAPDGVPRVLVADDGRAREQVVRLGLRTLDAVEVVEGLTDGAQVLLGRGAQAGDRVRPRAVGGGPASGAGGAADTGGAAGAALTQSMGR